MPLTRRALLLGAAAAGLAACSGPVVPPGPSSAGETSATGSSAAGPSSEGEASATGSSVDSPSGSATGDASAGTDGSATSTTSAAAQTVSVSDTVSGQIPTRTTVGAKAVGLQARDQAYILTTDHPEPTSVTTTGVPADATVVSSLVGVEQLASAPPAGAMGYLAQQAGSGLSGSSMILVVNPWQPTLGQFSGTPYPIVGDEHSQLVALTMVGGVTVAAVAYSDPKSHTDKVERVAFNDAGAVLWHRTDVDNRNTDASSGQPLAFLTADSLTANQAGQVIFGVDNQWLAVNPTTGAVVWTKPGESSAGITFDSLHLMAVDSYHDGGSNGKSVYDKRTGTKVSKFPVRSVSVDPIAGQLVLSYTTDDSTFGDPAPDTPGSPAYQVISVDTGKTLFTLDRSKAAGLGNIDVLGAFDGRTVVTAKDGTRVIVTTTGESDPGFANLPPQTFRFSGIPYLSEPNLAVQTTSNGIGQIASSIDSSITPVSVVLGAKPLTWDDLKVAVATS
jgi:hypothetical protein